MRLLVLGSGGREHALVWKLAQSKEVDALFCGPGNPGTAGLCENLPLRADDPAQVVSFAKERRVDLVVVGPEAPLVAGVVDALSAAGITAFGPTRAAAEIEGSKAFAKEVMRAAAVPTAEFRVFDSPEEAQAYAAAHGPVVVKADGLAAGKGVVVARESTQAVAAIKELAALKDAARRLVLEELLEGEEVSVIALCDGERYVLLPPAQDHKRVGDGDQGPNTGGMGAYTPVPFLSGTALEEIGERVIAPTLRELRHRGLTFRGALYAGLMMTASGPKVLEYNCRLGDPETQVLMMQVEADLVPELWACARGELKTRALRAHPGASVGVVLAADGYPAAPRLGDELSGLSAAGSKDVQLFHAGTRADGGRIVTAGGRVLTVCARGGDIAEARERAYSAIAKIHFRGMHHRRDIGARALA